MAFDYANTPATFGSGMPMQFTFLQQNLATSQASVATKISDVAGVTQWGALVGGQLLGVIAVANANITASTVRFVPTINGATITTLAAVNTATTVKVIQTARVAVANPYETSTRKFNAGDRIGVKHTTTATTAPTTLDWTVIVLAETTE